MAPTHEDIERRAFPLWQERGCPLGSPDVDWQHADQEFSDDQTSDGDAGGMAGGIHPSAVHQSNQGASQGSGRTP